MDTNTSQTRTDALSFLKHHKTGVLATVAPNGDPHASMVYYVADDEFNVYILTLMNTRKYAAVEGHPQVAFTVSAPEVPQTLQMEGVAMDISLDAEVSKKKEELFAMLNTNPWFHAPITKLDPSTTAVIWIRPTWIRWGDYAFAETGSEHVFTQIDPTA